MVVSDREWVILARPVVARLCCLRWRSTATAIGRLLALVEVARREKTVAEIVVRQRMSTRLTWVVFPFQGREESGMAEVRFLFFTEGQTSRNLFQKSDAEGQVRSNEEVASVSQDGGTLSKGPFPSNLVVLDKAFISVHKDGGHISLGVPKHAGVGVESNELGSSVRASS